MPVYSFLTFSNAALGRPGTSISEGTFTVTGKSALMNVRDNDSRFDDESSKNGETLDKSQQRLATGFDDTYPANRVVQSVYRYKITNHSTGQTGYAHLIRIYTGTNPSSPGTQSGEYYNTFTIPVHAGDTITLSEGNYIGQTPYSSLMICFTKGTMIATAKGPRPVQSLSPGDMVTTRDNGPQPLRWIGTRKVAALGNFAPIRIAQGVLDNSATLRVSPNHRMLITAASNDLHFGTTEVFVAAKHLLSHPGVRQISGGMVTYIHLLFDQHEVIFAHGAPSESLFPGTAALSIMDNDARQEVLTLFPELRQPQSTTFATAFATTARRCLTRQESRLLHHARAA